MSQVLRSSVRRLESPQAVSAGLVLTQDVRTLAPGGARTPVRGWGSGFGGGSKSKAFGAKGGSSGSWGLATQFHPLPTSTPHGHTCGHIFTPISTHTHTQSCEGSGPTTSIPGMSLDWYPVGGSTAAGLPRGWVLCVVTDWLLRRRLSNRYTHPLVLTDLSS